MNIFEEASRNGYRFSSSVGDLTTEQLWSLPLTAKSGASLDSVAKTIHKKIKETDEESFVVSRNTSSKEDETKLEIVKHIIAYKQEVNAKRLQEAEISATRNQLKEILAKKKSESLETLSIEELEKKLAEYGQ